MGRADSGRLRSEVRTAGQGHGRGSGWRRRVGVMRHDTGGACTVLLRHVNAGTPERSRPKCALTTEVTEVVADGQPAGRHDAKMAGRL